MQELDTFNVFLKPLNDLGIPYIITGAVAATIYGEPRMTHDLDLILYLQRKDVDRFIRQFPETEFYVPPEEVIRVEVGRASRGHMNIIHLKSGLRADIYLTGRDELQHWAMQHRRPVSVAGETIWIAPPEYVIVRKLQYYREGGSEKHLRDIRSMLETSREEIDFSFLEEKIDKFNLQPEWQKAQIEKN